MASSPQAQTASYAPPLPRALCNRSLDPGRWLLSSLAFGPNHDFKDAQGCCQGLKAFGAVESSVYGKGLNQPGQGWHGPPDTHETLSS